LSQPLLETEVDSVEVDLRVKFDMRVDFDLQVKFDLTVGVYLRVKLPWESALI